MFSRRRGRVGCPPELRATELLTQALALVDEARRLEDDALRQERFRDTEAVVLAAAYACRKAAR